MNKTTSPPYTIGSLAKAAGEGKQALAECRILDCFEDGWKC